MSVRMMKRPSSLMAGRATKRHSIDLEATKCAIVATAIHDTSDLTESMKAVLSGLVGSTLGVCKDMRHPFQTFAVDQIGEALHQTKATLQAAVDAAQEKLDREISSKAERDSAVCEAQAALAECIRGISEKNATLADAIQSLELATDELKEKGTAYEKGEHYFHEIALRKDALVAARAQKIMAVKERAATEQEVRTLITFGKQLGFDESMLTTAKKVFKMDPSQRGEFELVVLTCFEDAFSKSIAELCKSFEDALPLREEQRFATGAAKATQEKGINKLDACYNDLEDVKAAKL